MNKLFNGPALGIDSFSMMKSFCVTLDRRTRLEDPPHFFNYNFRKLIFVSIFFFILTLKLQNGWNALNIRKSYCNSARIQGFSCDCRRDFEWLNSKTFRKTRRSLTRRTWGMYESYFSSIFKLVSARFKILIFWHFFQSKVTGSGLWEAQHEIPAHE